MEILTAVLRWSTEVLTTYFCMSTRYENLKTYENTKTQRSFNRKTWKVHSQSDYVAILRADCTNYGRQKTKTIKFKTSDKASNSQIYRPFARKYRVTRGKTCVNEIWKINSAWNGQKSTQFKDKRCRVSLKRVQLVNLIGRYRFTFWGPNSSWMTFITIILGDKFSINVSSTDSFNDVAISTNVFGWT